MDDEHDGDEDKDDDEDEDDDNGDDVYQLTLYLLALVNLMTVNPIIY